MYCKLTPEILANGTKAYFKGEGLYPDKDMNACVRVGDRALSLEQIAALVLQERYNTEEVIIDEDELTECVYQIRYYIDNLYFERAPQLSQSSSEEEPEPDIIPESIATAPIDMVHPAPRLEGSRHTSPGKLPAQEGKWQGVVRNNSDWNKENSYPFDL